MLSQEIKRLKMANAATQATLDQTLEQLNHINNKLYFNEKAYEHSRKQAADLIIDLAAAEQNIELLANQNKELTNQLYEIQSS